MLLRNVLKSAVPSLVLAAFGGLSFAAEPAKGPAPTTKPVYPLSTCVVSGEKLGEMGKPFVIQHDGREVQFCCASCQKDFKKDPAKYLKKLDDAAKTRATQPVKMAETADPHAGHH
jgi:YHS domain-containing protein